HHDLAERVLSQPDELVEDEKAERDADAEREAEVRRCRAGPGQQRAAPPLPKPHILHHEPCVGDEKADAEHQQNGVEVHPLIESHDPERSKEDASAPARILDRRYGTLACAAAPCIRVRPSFVMAPASSSAFVRCVMPLTKSP